MYEDDLEKRMNDRTRHRKRREGKLWVEEKLMGIWTPHYFAPLMAPSNRKSPLDERAGRHHPWHGRFVANWGREVKAEKTAWHASR